MIYGSLAFVYIALGVLLASLVYAANCQAEGKVWADRYIVYALVAGAFWPVFLPWFLTQAAVRAFGGWFY